ncbi:MAG TPA: proprotein convertase P-domain-containing protein, partial [Actinomycetota bacterium]|nr:proprotein convertase P-domain-containing protein [Actinomycetota bacterium]
PSDASGFCEVLNLTTDPSLDCIPEATELDVGYLCDTEGGSSGSPVLGYSDHKVIALHHCGGCANSGVQITGVIASLGPNVPPGSVFSPAGVVALDGSVYGCSGTIGIEVRDDNLIGAGSQGVTVESTTEAAPEPVTLAESPPASGRFLGTIPATAGPVAGGDSLLSVADGDTITARYLDLDDGTGNPAARTDTATVDCVAPIITNVQAINVTGNSADITFTTGEGASSTATYGLASSPPPASTASNSALVTSHSVHLTGLLPCRDYIFSVSAADAAGNTATNDNAGAYYTFSTGVNASPTYQATGLPVSIPDNNPTGASSSIAVPDINPVADVNVLVRITHTYDGDLVLSLTGPNGATVTLSDRRGASGDNFTDTLFDDAAATSISAGVAPFAGSFRPESALSAFNGISAAGTWTLRAVDIAGLDVGTVDRFEMHFTYPPQACGPYIRHQSHTVADACSGAGSGGDGVVDPGEDLSIPVVLANTGTDPADDVTAVLSTTTPGVSVVTGSASYGTVAPGQTAAGSNPYVVHVGDSVPCGTLIDLQIAASATGGGPWSEAFTVRVGTPVVSGPTTHSSTDVPRAILDAATVTSVINVSSTSSVVDVNVGFTLTHPWDADLDISLVGPNGAVVELTTDNGSSGDNYTNTLFDDSAATAITAGTAPFTGTFRPEQPLAALNGIPANGAWTLRITDDESPDAGNLLSWFIVLTVQSGFLCNACVVLVPPGEVGSLRFGAPDTLEWGPVATATGYRVYRGVRSDLPRLYTTDPDSCLRTTSASTSMSGLGETPPASDFSWWLVRAANGVGEGPAGSGTPGPRIHDSAGACP